MMQRKIFFPEKLKKEKQKGIEEKKFGQMFLTSDEENVCQGNLSKIGESRLMNRVADYILNKI